MDTKPTQHIMKNTISRRRFVTTTAATGLFSMVPRHLPGAPGQTPPGGKLNIAVIGLGVMGSSNVKACASKDPRGKPRGICQKRPNSNCPLCN